MGIADVAIIGALVAFAGMAGAVVYLAVGQYRLREDFTILVDVIGSMRASNDEWHRKLGERQ